MTDGENRTEALERLVADIRACRICRDTPSGARLPHEPRPVVVPSHSARIAICGQAPGTRVHASGRPFNDPSGVRLRQWLGVDETAFYDPDRFAIVPMGFCFPGHDKKGGDLPPRRECRKVWHDRLFALMPQLRLKLVIGSHARAYHLPDTRHETLADSVADWRKRIAENDPDSCLSLALPHPSWRNNAWLHRNPWFEGKCLPDIRRLVANHTG